MRRLAFDLLVVGAGPSGLAAVAAAAQSGASVGLVDDNQSAGGQIWRGAGTAADSAQALQWLARAAGPRVQAITCTKIIAQPAPGTLLAESPAEPLAFAYDRLVLAPGARELFLPFPGWTLPGVMGAGGLQALVKGGHPIAGKRVVVAGSGPLLLATASYLRSKGANILLIAEQAPWSRLAAFALHVIRDRAKLAQSAILGWDLRRVPFRAGSWVIRASGMGRLNEVTVSSGRRERRYRCDYLACGFGLVPNLELPIAIGCKVEEGAVQVDECQRTSIDGVYCAGEATGIGGLESALTEGTIAGLAATDRLSQAQTHLPARARAQRFAGALAKGYSLRPELKSLCEPGTVVCRCEDVPYIDLRQHAIWRSAKLLTRCGMGPCQGRVCGPAAEFLFGWEIESVRPPIFPARIGSLAQVEVCGSSSEEVLA